MCETKCWINSSILVKYAPKIYHYSSPSDYTNNPTFPAIRRYMAYVILTSDFYYHNFPMFLSSEAASDADIAANIPIKSCL